MARYDGRSFVELVGIEDRTPGGDEPLFLVSGRGSRMHIAHSDLADELMRRGWFFKFDPGSRLVTIPGFAKIKLTFCDEHYFVGLSPRGACFLGDSIPWAGYREIMQHGGWFTDRLV